MNIENFPDFLFRVDVETHSVDKMSYLRTEKHFTAYRSSIKAGTNFLLIPSDIGNSCFVSEIDALASLREHLVNIISGIEIQIRDLKNAAQ